MKRIVVAEVLYPEGHKYYNERLIGVLSSIADVLLLDNGSYYNAMTLPSNVEKVMIKHSEPSVERFYRVKKFLPFIKYEPLLLLSYIKYYYRISRIAKKYGIKKIVLLTVQNNALSMSLPFFKGIDVYIFHHNDIDAIDYRPIDTKLFKLSMNKVYHMVLAQFIKDGLIKLSGVGEDRVYVIHEPSSIDKDVDKISFTGRQPIIIGLGTTCEENVLKEFEELDKKYTTKLPFSIILRNKEIEYEGNNLRIIKKYLTREEFDYFLSNATACLVLYPNDFKMRYSGIIDDALNNGMGVYGSNIPVMHYFSKEYPESCHILYSAEDCFSILQKEFKTAETQDIKRFIQRHSFEYVKNQLIEALFSK